MHPRILKRFLQYSSVGTSTFALDLALIYLLKTQGGFSDSGATTAGFLIAISLNFLISYHWVFRGTDRSKISGYLTFLSIATVGLGLVLGGTLLIQHFFHTNIYLARAVVAGLVGLGNFLFNHFVNFRTHRLPPPFPPQS